MTRTERFCWTAFVLGFLAMFVGTAWQTREARAQSRPAPQVATDWRQLTGTPQSVDLASIRPLEIVHYSWPLREADVLPAPAWWLSDFVRITRGATVHADTATTEAHVRAVARIAAQYRASVAIVHTPYHHASWADGDPRHVDATYWPFWTARLTAMKGWVEAEGASVRCIIFDSERFRIQPADGSGMVDQAKSIDDAKRLTREWNAAARARYDEAYDAVKGIFGAEVYVEWYSRGWYRPIGVTAWQRNAGPYYHFDGSEKGDGVSAVVTRPDWTEPSISAVYETLLRGKPTDRLVTWIWLGSGYRYASGTLSVDDDWDFGTDAARGLARLRSDFRGRQACIIFYPSPGSNPHWLRHFAEYAK